MKFFKRKKKDKTMKVQFTLNAQRDEYSTYNGVDSRKITTFRNMLYLALDMTEQETYNIVGCLREGKKVVIQCNGEQFARFIIERNNADLNNGIKNLNAEILDDKNLGNDIYLHKCQ